MDLEVNLQTKQILESLRGTKILFSGCGLFFLTSKRYQFDLKQYIISCHFFRLNTLNPLIDS